LLLQLAHLHTDRALGLVELYNLESFRLALPPEKKVSEFVHRVVHYYRSDIKDLLFVHIGNILSTHEGVHRILLQFVSHKEPKLSHALSVAARGLRVPHL
jgi:hypothetical protein